MTVNFLDRPQETVRAFLEAKAQPNMKGEERTVLVVCPTHNEIDRYNEAIRDHLKAGGKLQGGQNLGRLEALNWTHAHRKDVRRYQPGQVLVFHKGVKNVRKNEFVMVLRAEKGKIISRSADGKEIALSGKQAGAFGVFRQRSIEVAPGDQLLLLANRKQRGLEVTNGDVGIVRMVDSQGRIHLQGGRVLPANYRQFKHGYAMTAHRSQSKTVDAVIVSADRMAGDLFYVAVSRAREFVRVLTSNLPLLRESVAYDSTRRSATELAKQAKGKEKHRRRHTVLGKARIWARKAARAWQKKMFVLGRHRDAKCLTPTFRFEPGRSVVLER